MNFKKGILLISILLIANIFAMKLPPPSKIGGKPLMEALSERQTMRSFSSKELSDEMLSNLLWAGFGVNRDSGRRTAPSARNWQEIDIYVAKADGLYLYEAEDHSLKQILDEDIRGNCGKQGFLKDAAVVLVYVANRKTMGMIPSSSKDFYSAIDTGYISQNVYLFCSSEGLSTVAIGMVNKDKLAEKMNLEDHQKVIITQPVGHPE